MSALSDTRIQSQHAMVSPLQLKAELPVSPAAQACVENTRAAIERILRKEDGRKLMVVGPCSIHDCKAALEYAQRLRVLAEEISDQFLVVMRAYFEKPRTTTGWKGLINDPNLDDSFDIDKGVRMARSLLRDINDLGLPTGTEALDPLMPQYLGDLISWTAIGARTTESQTHREMASGLSTPVGFKNGTDGSLVTAVNAMKAASTPHSFLGIDLNGRSAITQTRGNPYGHVILRGGKQPNYQSNFVRSCRDALGAAHLPANIMIDCSHGNSAKDPARQGEVLADVVTQIALGDGSLIGMMLESHLVAGNQALGSDPGALTYGQSITDACIGWDDTRRMLTEAAERLRSVRGTRWAAADPLAAVQ